ncbi:MAG TPA: CoA pyrophosphatase [Chloroflexi bacterium]|jgi:8-oxo-dGTP pyrophosphatase MutT (NUDIX family)|nr:CoA pyrophosphatase [Chloroflexota bacterium]
MTLPPLLAGLNESLLPMELECDSGAGPVRHSAVLLLLYPRNGQVHFVLTRRRDDLTRHPGQVSLPGGVAEEQDGSLWDTAVRETCEEICLRPGRLVRLGRLDSYHLRMTDYVIHPFVAWNPARPVLSPDDREVAEIIEEPLSRLINPSCLAEETWEFRDQQWLVTFYRLGEVKVWGATAHILSDLARRLRPDWNPGSSRPGDVRAL